MGLPKEQPYTWSQLAPHVQSKKFEWCGVLHLSPRESLLYPLCVDNVLPGRHIVY